MPFVQQQRREGGARQIEDNHTMEEESCVLEKYEQQVKYKDVGDDIKNRAMIKVTKQKQVEGEEEEKQRTVSQQKRPQLTEKGK